MIRKVEKGDLQAIAAIHKENFGDHFLGKFSESLIAKFYACFIGGESFIADFSAQGECRGFILGGDNKWIQACSSQFMRSCRHQYVTEIIVRPNTWPGTIKKVYDLVSFWLKGHLRQESQSQRIKCSSYRLLSIAVAKRHQHAGVASGMVKFYEENCPSDSYGLTVHDHNMKAIRFYQKMGMREAYRKKGSIGFERVLAKTRVAL